MAYPFAGTINGTVTSTSQNLPMIVEGFTLVPRVSGTVNVYKITVGSQEISIIPLNKSVNAGEIYQGTNRTVLLPTELIKIQTTSQFDYDFTINNLKVPTEDSTEL
jgi:hypothetical protein